MHIFRVWLATPEFPVEIQESLEDLENLFVTYTIYVDEDMFFPTQAFCSLLEVDMHWRNDRLADLCLYLFWKP